MAKFTCLFTGVRSEMAAKKQASLKYEGLKRKY